MMKILDKIYEKVVAYLINMCYSIIRIGRLGVKSMNKYSAIDIATWFIYKTNAEKKENQTLSDEYEVYEGLTHLKLQKLLYYAQGISLASRGKAIFSDAIQAWGHGPVVKTVFDTFSKKGRAEILLEDAPEGSEIIRKLEADSEVREVLNITYDNFAIFTAWQLRNMTHIKNGPWDKNYVSGKNKVIPQKDIKLYFETEIME